MEVIYPKKYVIMMGITMTAQFFILIWAVVCFVRIYRRFKFTDKILSLSAICVIVSLISQLVAQTLQIILYTDIIKFNLLLYQIQNIFLTMQIMTMFNVFLFDIFKWCIFIICSSNSGNLQCDKEVTQLEVKHSKLRTALIVIQSIVILSFTTIMILFSMFQKYKDS